MHSRYQRAPKRGVGVGASAEVAASAGATGFDGASRRTTAVVALK
jgi:hypothetical protein